MTHVYLYAITDDSDGPGPAGAGMDDSPVQSIAEQGVTAWISPLTRSRVPADVDNVWRHENVIEELMASSRPVLPFRFGTVVAGPGAVEHLLQSRGPELARNLDRVRGRVEVSLRVLWPGDIDPPAAEQAAPSEALSGRAFIMARLAVMQREQAGQAEASRLAAEVEAPLIALAGEHLRQVLPSPRQLLVSAYLVDRTRMDEFTSEVDRLPARHPDLRFLCTGPWPAYSFVSCGMFDGS